MLFFGWNFMAFFYCSRGLFFGARFMWVHMVRQSYKFQAHFKSPHESYASALSTIIILSFNGYKNRWRWIIIQSQGTVKSKQPKNQNQYETNAVPCGVCETRENHLLISVNCWCDDQCMLLRSNENVWMLTRAATRSHTQGTSIDHGRTGIKWRSTRCWKLFWSSTSQHNLKSTLNDGLIEDDYFAFAWST